MLYLPDLAATQEAGRVLAKKILPGEVLYLQGELGAGKTSWVQGVLQGLGYRGVVASPTYTLVESYVFPNLTLFHFDFYRLKDPEELRFIGIEEYFTPQSICVIEWPERATGLIPPPNWHIYLSYERVGRLLRVEKI